MRNGLRKNPKNFAAMINLSETELLVGQIAAAASTAEKAAALSAQAGDVFSTSVAHSTQADALCAAGDLKTAQGLFVDAERLERQRLVSVRGYAYCDLLLCLGRAAEARDRATQSIGIARRVRHLLSVSLDTLTLGRAHLALPLQGLATGNSIVTICDDARSAITELDEAVEGLRASGRHDFLARGLLARAACRRAIGEWDGAKRDLDEAKEIAEPGLMRLYWCDCALEGARLALARREAFAPLAGLVERSPAPPAPPDAAATVAFREEAREQLDVARKLIAECGYHRRDEELAELDAVIAGARRFADLPPRV
jgi:tetratricopeptide (TPR) repeat protein